MKALSKNLNPMTQIFQKYFMLILGKFIRLLLCYNLSPKVCLRRVVRLFPSAVSSWVAFDIISGLPSRSVSFCSFGQSRQAHLYNSKIRINCKSFLKFF